MDIERRKKLDTLLIHLRFDIDRIEWIKGLKDDYSEHVNEYADNILEEYGE